MRPTRIPEPPAGSRGMPEIFEGGIYGVIRRAVVIGNGFAGSENQSIGLVRALGLSSRQSLYRVTRPRGGINEWLHWLPVSLHKKLNFLLRRICSDIRFQVTVKGNKVMPLSFKKSGIAGLLTYTSDYISTHKAY